MDKGQAGSGEQVQLPLNCGEHDGYWYIFTADEKHFSVCDREIDARFLVEACNSHASLSAENATLREQIERLKAHTDEDMKLLAAMREQRDAMALECQALRKDAQELRDAAIKLLTPGKLGRVMEAARYSPHWSSYNVNAADEIADVDQARRELLVAAYPGDSALAALAARSKT